MGDNLKVMHRFASKSASLIVNLYVFSRCDGPPMTKTC